MRPFYVGLLSERLRANASFKPTQLKRSLMCMTANLIFLTTFLIKQKSSRHAAESSILKSNTEQKQRHTYDYASLIVPTCYCHRETSIFVMIILFIH